MTLANAKEYFNRHNITYGGETELRILCPFCENPNKKCYVNNNTGEFYCFHCGNGGKFQYLTERLNKGEKAEIKPQETEDKIEPDLPPIDPEYIIQNHKNLMEGGGKVLLDTYFYTKRGFSDQTLHRFQLGWDGRNIVIPIFNANDECVNFKLKRDPTLPTQSNGMFQLTGRGKKRLFNEVVIKKKQERVIICEGEWDCMLLDQYGYAAVTSTGGALSFDPSWVSAFSKAEKIYICFDRDRNQAGQKGAEKTAKMFLDKGVRTYIVELPQPLSNESKLDVTDYFVKRSKTKEDFSWLLRQAREYNGNIAHDTILHFINGKDFMAKVFPKEEWIVDKLIPAKGMTMLSGEPGSYKSWLGFYIGLCVIRGIPVLDKFDTALGNVLFIDKENIEQQIQERFRMLGAGDEIEKVFFLTEDFLATRPEDVFVLENFIRDNNIILTIMDSFVRLHDKEENSATEMNRVTQQLTRLQRAGSALLIIHHLNKNVMGMKVKALDRLRGSADIAARLDSLVAVEVVEKGVIKLDHGKSRYVQAVPTMLIGAYSEKEKMSFGFIKDVEEGEVEHFVIADAIMGIIGEQSASSKFIIEQLQEHAGRAKIQEVLKELRTSGRLTAYRMGKEFLYAKNKIEKFLELEVS